MKTGGLFYYAGRDEGVLIVSRSRGLAIQLKDKFEWGGLKAPAICNFQLMIDKYDNYGYNKSYSRLPINYKGKQPGQKLVFKYCS